MSVVGYEFPEMGSSKIRSFWEGVGGFIAHVFSV